MMQVSVLAMTLAVALFGSGAARAHQQVPSPTPETGEHISQAVSGDVTLDRGGDSRKVGEGVRLQVLRCYQHGIRVLDEPVSVAPADTLARSAAVQTRASDGRKLAVYAVGSGLCVLML